jgi:hypothetical protein
MDKGARRGLAASAGSARRAARAALGLIAAAASALGLVGGCASQEKLRDQELTQLLAWLPGRYESGVQADSSARRSLEPPPQRIALLIVKVYTPRLGRHVLFAQETAADDPRRVMSERMWSFRVDNRRGILETVYAFKDPVRWRDGQEHLELFTSVVAEDVLTVPGCELAWEKAGEEFTATQDQKLCRDAGGTAVRSAEQTSDTLVLGEYRFGKTR